MHQEIDHNNIIQDFFRIIVFPILSLLDMNIHFQNKQFRLNAIQNKGLSPDSNAVYRILAGARMRDSSALAL